MRTVLFLLTVATILFFGSIPAYSCNKLPAGLEKNRDYQIFVSRPATAFRVRVVEIDTRNCWIKGQFLRNNDHIYIYIDDIMAISENITSR